VSEGGRHRRQLYRRALGRRRAVADSEAGLLRPLRQSQALTNPCGSSSAMWGSDDGT